MNFSDFFVFFCIFLNLKSIYLIKNLLYNHAGDVATRGSSNGTIYRDRRSSLMGGGGGVRGAILLPANHFKTI